MDIGNKHGVRKILIVLAWMIIASVLFGAWGGWKLGRAMFATFVMLDNNIEYWINETLGFYDD